MSPQGTSRDEPVEVKKPRAGRLGHPGGGGVGAHGAGEVADGDNAEHILSNSGNQMIHWQGLRGEFGGPRLQVQPADNTALMATSTTAEWPGPAAFR